MNLAVLMLDLRLKRTSTLLWVLATAAISAVYLAVYPTVKDVPELNDFVARLPEALREAFGMQDYTSPIGYLQTEVFSGLMPVVLLVLAIGRGAASIAGEEEAGRLDLVLSQPVRRREVYLAKAAELVVAVAAVTALGVTVPVLVVGPWVGLDVAIAPVLAISVQLFLFALLAGLIAEAVGAAAGRKGVGIAAAVGLFVAGFLVNALATTVDWLERLQPLSAWRWYSGNSPLVNGLGLKEVVVLSLAGLLTVVVGASLFARRDLRT
jgi:ABC-2 type transport system permease protein